MLKFQTQSTETLKIFNFKLLKIFEIVDSNLEFKESIKFGQ